MPGEAAEKGIALAFVCPRAGPCRVTVAQEVRQHPGDP